MKIFSLAGVLGILFSMTVHAADLASYAGRYSAAETDVSCGEVITVEVGTGTMLVALEQCVSGGSDSVTSIYRCDAGNTCAIDTRYEQGDVCAETRLTLLPSGNILLSNPCRHRSVEWLRSS